MRGHAVLLAARGGPAESKRLLPPGSRGTGARINRQMNIWRGPLGPSLLSPTTILPCSQPDLQEVRGSLLVHSLLIRTAEWVVIDGNTPVISVGNTTKKRSWYILRFIKVCPCFWGLWGPPCEIVSPPAEPWGLWSYARLSPWCMDILKICIRAWYRIYWMTNPLVGFETWVWGSVGLSLS